MNTLKAWNKANYDGITEEDKRKIRIILGMTAARSFTRCPSKSKGEMRKLREAGDFSHEDHSHICDKCRCKRIAGARTGGDFYNIGKKTGHYGVGFCSDHEKRGMTPEQAIAYAREQMELIRSGTADKDPDHVYDLMVRNGNQSVESAKVRSDVELVVNTLNEFKQRVSNENEALSEYISGGKDGAILAKMSDETRMRLGLEIAKTLSKLNLDYFKMDKEHFIHVDEVKIRLPRMIDAVRLGLVYMKELSAKYKPGDTDPAVLTMEKVVNDFREIWLNAKAV